MTKDRDEVWRSLWPCVNTVCSGYKGVIKMMMMMMNFNQTTLIYQYWNLSITIYHVLHSHWTCSLHSQSWQWHTRCNPYSKPVLLWTQHASSCMQVALHSCSPKVPSDHSVWSKDTTVSQDWGSSMSVCTTHGCLWYPVHSSAGMSFHLLCVLSCRQHKWPISADHWTFPSSLLMSQL